MFNTYTVIWAEMPELNLMMMMMMLLIRLPNYVI